MFFSHDENSAHFHTFFSRQRGPIILHSSSSNPCESRHEELYSYIGICFRMKIILISNRCPVKLLNTKTRSNFYEVTKKMANFTKFDTGRLALENLISKE